ncbi:hypothetical protein LCGC14_1478440 [marine sediment metagenome]|uniref:Uncharacterized protein n=1 Tax=marine sediment metagenome TaxID=412755 RepID=A0A0F9MBV9_9ZZZZ
MKFIHKETSNFIVFPEADRVELACPACLLYSVFKVNKISICEHCEREVAVTLKAKTTYKEEE